MRDTFSKNRAQRACQDLTPRQQQVLSFIIDFQRSNGMPPTRVEIAHHFGWASANAAEEHVRALIRKGALRAPTHQHARAIYPV